MAEPNVATHQTLSLPALIQSFPEALTFWAEQTPDAPALRALDGRVWTHGDVRGAVAGIAGRFAMLGVQPDAPIALILPPGAEACLALLGASVAAVAAPLNPKGTVHELRRDLRRLGTTLVVTVVWRLRRSKGSPRSWVSPRSQWRICWPRSDTQGCTQSRCPPGTLTISP